MTGNDTERAKTPSPDEFEDEITVRSQLSELIRIPAWIEALATRHAITDNVAFAMNLCLEESVSNVIRHGYCGQEGCHVTVRFSVPREGFFLLTVDDDAPHFDPLIQPPLPAITVLEPVAVGGQGIRLMRSFSDSLEYSATTAGNQLRIGFLRQPPTTPTK